MLTSVILVTYYTGPVLFQAIASVLAETEPVELCLVDNGNPEDVMTIVRAMAEDEPRMRLITGHGNVGFGTACNLGARAASGDYLLFLNPDSLLPQGTLAKLFVHARFLKRPFMIGARLLDENGQDQRGGRRALLTPTTALIEALHLGSLFPKARLNFNEDEVPRTLSPMPAISGAFMFLPHEDFWCIKGFDEGYFLHVEDLDFCLRFRRAGGEIYFAPDVPVTHIGGTSQATSFFLEKHKANGFIRYFHQNFGEQYPAVFLWVLDVAIWARAVMKLIAIKIKGIF